MKDKNIILKYIEKILNEKYQKDLIENQNNMDKEKNDYSKKMNFLENARKRINTGNFFFRSLKKLYYRIGDFVAKYELKLSIILSVITGLLVLFISQELTSKIFNVNNSSTMFFSLFLINSILYYIYLYYTILCIDVITNATNDIKNKYLYNILTPSLIILLSIILPTYVFKYFYSFFNYNINFIESMLIVYTPLVLFTILFNTISGVNKSVKDKFNPKLNIKNLKRKINMDYQNNINFLKNGTFEKISNSCMDEKISIEMNDILEKSLTLEEKELLKEKSVDGICSYRTILLLLESLNSNKKII